ncbi:hypothetical protein MTR67_001427 [Solanum verrucosum]|uniref:Uncharacterized protein n=1 Tax=Solanum verrucosum TaxID=315347 RepID=A0AAF0PP92_SOLVR|nr:hypothetical protein MTR67_001427 [Solanum verrucosum]
MICYCFVGEIQGLFLACTKSSAYFPRLLV